MQKNFLLVISLMGSIALYPVKEQSIEPKSKRVKVYRKWTLAEYYDGLCSDHDVYHGHKHTETIKFNDGRTFDIDYNKPQITQNNLGRPLITNKDLIANRDLNLEKSKSDLSFVMAKAASDKHFKSLFGTASLN